jgi:hypothetical protein
MKLLYQSLVLGLKYYMEVTGNQTESMVNHRCGVMLIQTFDV